MSKAIKIFKTRCRLTAACMTLCLGACTEYGKGFSQREFEKVRIGMAEAEVLAKLGEPLFINCSYQHPSGDYVPLETSDLPKKIEDVKWDEHLVTLYFSAQKHSHFGYQRRAIQFTRGKVSRIIAVKVDE